MKQRQPAVAAAAFAAVILASLLLVRPRGPAVAPRSAAQATAAPPPARSPVAPAAPRVSATPRPTASAARPARPAAAPAASAAPAAAAAAPAASVARSGGAAPEASSPPAAPSSVAAAGASPEDEATDEPEPALQAASAPAPDARLTGAVTGAVRGADGEAIAGTTVLAVSADGEDAAETTTDDDGVFLVPGLRPGRYALFAGLGTPVASRVAGRGVEVGPAAVSRIDLVEPPEGTLVRVSPHDALGRPAEAQAVLVSGAPSATGAVASLLASDAIYLPELGSERTLLPRVPPGVYTLVVLQGAGVPVRAAREPLRISSEPELVVKIEVASAPAPRG